MRLIIAGFMMGAVAFLSGISAQAQEKKAQPTMVLRIQSVNKLQENLFFLAESVGKKEEARQVEGLLKLMTGPKGLEGIDPEKPFGFYGYLGANVVDSDLVVLVPIADEKTFLAMLVKLNLPVKKGEQDVYSMNIPNLPFPLMFKFKHGYLCATMRDDRAIDDKRLIAPRDILQAEKTGVLSLALNIAGIPEELIKNIIPQVELAITQARQEKKPGESPFSAQLRKDATEYFMQLALQILNQGEEFLVKLDVDRKAGDIELSASLEGKKGSELAKTISQVGALKGYGPSLRSKDSALHTHVNFTLPEFMRKELVRSFLEEAEKGLANEKDETKKKAGGELLKGIKPALERGVIDLGMDIRNYEGGKFGVVIGAQVEKVSALEDWLKMFHKELPDSERKKIELGVAKEGNVNIHKVHVPIAPGEVKYLGNGPAYLAFGENLVLFAVGEKARELVSESLKAKPSTGSVMEFEMSFRRAAGLMTRQFPAAVDVAQKVFKETPEADRIRYTLQAGNKISLKVGVKAQVLGFMKAVEEAGKK